MSMQKDRASGVDLSISKTAWWKDRFTRLPVWAWILIVLAGLMVLGIFLPDMEDPPVASTAGESSQIDAASGTSVPRTTPTTIPVRDDRRFRLSFGYAFSGLRSNLMDSVEGINSFQYDIESDVVTLDTDATSVSDSEKREDAWALTQFLSFLWDPEIISEPDVWSGPKWHVTVGTVTYECAPQTMMAIAKDQLSRDQWESRCLVQ
jgi:hypothetical protein